MKTLVDPLDMGQLTGVAAMTPPGAFIEVGVYQGGSAMPLAHVAKCQDRDLYLCDTFKGIPHANPEKGDQHQVGDFSDVDVVELRHRFSSYPSIRWVVGVFPQSINGDAGRFAFAHLDCDQYRSVKESAEWLIPRMVKGGVIWFDDVDRLDGATRAAEELFGSKLRRDLSHPYVRFE